MNNIKNKLITKQELESLLSTHLNVNVQVSNLDIYIQAFVHKSFTIKESFVDEDDRCCMFYLNLTSNERLEFLGDSILNMVTAEYLYMKYPSKDEGFLTKLRTKLVRNTQLSHIGSKLGFNNWLLISSSIESIHGRYNPRLIEDVFESFIASLYKDQGFYTTRDFIFSCFDKYVDINYLVQNNDNYKDTLLRYYQLNVWNHPVYKTVGEISKKVFNTVVLVQKDLCTEYPGISDIILKNNEMTSIYQNFDENYIVGYGQGKTKKESEQNASKQALEILKVAKNF